MFVIKVDASTQLSESDNMDTGVNGPEARPFEMFSQYKRKRNRENPLALRAIRHRHSQVKPENIEAFQRQQRLEHEREVRRLLKEQNDAAVKAILATQEKNKSISVKPKVFINQNELIIWLRKKKKNLT